jgi:carboxymethylenebutenolidase
VIGFYGAPGRVGPYGPGPTEHAAELGAPILALFAGTDEGIPPRAVAEFDAALTATAVLHEIVTYPGAPHGFFDITHADHQPAVDDAWRRVLSFLAAPRARLPHDA